MRYTLLYIMVACLCWGCQHEEAPVVEVESHFVLPPSNLSDAEKSHRHSQIQQELNYYLERHNVQDEGFDMVARYAEEGDSTLSAYMPEGALLLQNMAHWSQWKREGKGMTRGGKGRIIIGWFHADTLASGVRIDPQGIYAGQFNAQMEASGHGSYRHYDGSYYEGHWQRDRREGFGFCVSLSNLRAGRWRADRFLGEKMQYTSERIYGIDISRYQHEQGRRVYPIAWQQLCITHLGRYVSSERITGEVNYPVSFVYIKSTEGITVQNKYFAADYQNCRKRRIPVGAYHFFSTKQDAGEQARFFLENTRFTRGDLPPVLDLEPSDALIEKMGGPEVLFSAVRVWLKMVERATGARPLLYVNQRFVNIWLDRAPDLRQDYHFWIARYGEYKPDIHLSLWQLSPYGRVRGIQGHVDLNVFNGYQGQWDDFLREETIK